MFFRQCVQILAEMEGGGALRRSIPKINWRWALFPIGYYGANAVYQGYISLYYTQLGFRSDRLGCISAATALAAIAAQPLWGTLGDRTKKRTRLLSLLCVAAALSLLPALLGKGLGLQILTAALFYAFFCALLPLGDAILLEGLGEGGGFGPYRLAGGLSFAVSGAIYGALSLPTGGAVWCTSILLAATALAAHLLPDSPGQQRARVPFARLLRNKELLILILFLLPVQSTMGYFYTFYAPHFKALPGGTDALLGLSYLISAASEIPYLLLCDRIYRRCGAAKPVCVAAGVMALRWLLLGSVRSAIAALLTQLLHGGGFIVLSVSMAKYVADKVAPELRTSGQMLLNMVSFGAARVIGNLGGGLLAEHIGRAAAFLTGAGVCAAALVAFTLWRLHGRASAT